jgi:DNA-binding CsgD family transcriptional regulator
MPSTDVQVSSTTLAPHESGGLERQLAAERTMVRSVILGILIALPITIAVAIGMMGLAISEKESWYGWVGLGAGIGAYAALFFGTWAGVVYSAHTFDELDEEAMHSSKGEPEGPPRSSHRTAGDGLYPAGMDTFAELRPLERRVSKLAAGGMVPAEIGRKFNRSEEFVERVLLLAGLPGRSAPEPQHGLTPLERCMLRWREQGVSTFDMADRFRRGPGYIEQVLELADYKLHRS